MSVVLPLLLALTVGAEERAAWIWNPTAAVRLTDANGSRELAPEAILGGRSLPPNVEVCAITGSFLLTDERGRHRELGPGECYRTAVPDSGPTDPMWEILSWFFLGGHEDPGVKASAEARAAELVEPTSTWVADWTVHLVWRLPLCKSQFARVIGADGTQIGDGVLMKTAEIDLTRWPIPQDLSQITVEIVQLSIPRQTPPEWLRGPAQELLDRHNSLVTAVVRTRLRRGSPPPPPAELYAWPPLAQVAWRASNGQLSEARSLARTLDVDPAPDAWTRALSGVEVLTR